ncbi:zinc finger protein 721-like [Eurosta solidaginis]|uniref:zinc finger protein 721-like n=1 Tax=Eurosta solidaginis TaxID=178769 RepID=UPI00353061C6
METAENKVTNDEWKCWCRLCAKENAINMYMFPEPQQDFTSANGKLNSIQIIDFIEEFFQINIKKNEDLPQLLCTPCVALVTKLVKFVGHVKEVQCMYDTIRLTGEWKPIDLKMLRDKCILHENDIYTLKTPPPSPIHNDCTLAKSTIEKVFVADLSGAVTQNLLDAIVKNEFISDEVASGVLHSNIEDKYESHEFDNDDNVDDPFADNLNENLTSENETCNSESKINVSKSLEVAPIEKVDEKKRVGYLKKNSIENKCNDKVNKIETSTNSDEQLISRSKEKRRVRDYKKKSVDGHSEKKEKKLIEKKYTCVECSIHFQQDGNYRTHMKKKHGIIEEPLKCSECPKSFESLNKLNRHLKTHRPEDEKKIFPCAQCERKFTSKDYAAKHIKFVHEDIRSFICEECGEAVRTEATLREHMLIHTDYAPFVCEICNKGFKNQYRLKSHKEIHSCNKYICNECGLQLNSRVTFNRHMLVHSDVLSHKCEYCGRAFKRAKSLKSHLILHSGLKPYSCNFCDKTFANGANCRSHKRKSHPGELAALEAAGLKTYTKNIPKLEVLKAVTRSAENLLPVVTKQSGNFSSGKRPKPTSDSAASDCAVDAKASKVQKNFENMLNQSSEKVLTNQALSQVESFKERKLDADSLTTTTTLSNIPTTLCTVYKKAIATLISNLTLSLLPLTTRDFCVISFDALFRCLSETSPDSTFSLTALAAASAYDTVPAERDTALIQTFYCFTMSEGSAERIEHILGGKWKEWCRLCAKADAKYINVIVGQSQRFINDNTLKCDKELANSILEFLRIHINEDDKLPQVICNECHDIVLSLIEFSERVNKVQRMYNDLRNSINKSTTNWQMLLENYGLCRDELLMPQSGIELPVENIYVADLEVTTISTPTLSISNSDMITKIEKRVEITQRDDSEMQSLHPISAKVKNFHEASSAVTEDIFSSDIDCSWRDENLSKPSVLKMPKNIVKNKENENFCIICLKNFDRRSNLTVHMKKYHEVLLCRLCTNTFKSELELKQHMKEQHCKIWRCTQCEQTFERKGFLSNHIKQAHNPEKKTRRSSENLSIVKTTSFVCEVCDKDLRTRKKLKLHLRTHAEYTFECKKCGKILKTLDIYRVFQRHLQIHGDNYICPHCGMQLSSKATYNSHMLVHSDTKKHICDVCGRAFKRGRGLKYHLISHTGLKPYSCDFCGNKFTNGSSCRLHKKTIHPKELAEQEASGAKTFTYIPKLDTLKAVARTGTNFKPLMSKQNGYVTRC